MKKIMKLIKYILQQVKINGSNHEIMIRGKDKNNPVIIFVYGGPGCSEIPYAISSNPLIIRNLKRRKSFINGCAILLYNKFNLNKSMFEFPKHAL